MFERCRDGIDAIASAALAGPFAVYGVGADGVVPECVVRGYFARLRSGSDFVLISDDPSFVGRTLQSNGVTVGPVYGFDHLRSVQLTSVVILEKASAFRLFERVYALGKVSANNIFIPKDTWQDRTYRRDDILQTVLQKIGPMGTKDGGLSSIELLTHIIDCLIELRRRAIPGDILNFGVYKGWSMQFLAEVSWQIGLDRSIHGFDTFSGFVDDGNPKNTFVQYMKGRFGADVPIHTDTSLGEVQEKLSRYQNTELVCGDIRETIKYLDGRKISFALFDMDDYTPTKVGLKTVYDLLSPGGFIIHDHFSLPSCEGPGTYGQRLAMLELLEHTRMFNLTGTNVFVKM